jgi:hypothetical protein
MAGLLEFLEQGLKPLGEHRPGLGHGDAPSSTRVWLLTLLAMLAFAGNSLLCKMALSRTDTDAARFTDRPWPLGRRTR